MAVQSERYESNNVPLRQLHPSRSEANLAAVAPQLADRVRQMNRGDRSSLEVQRSLRAVKAEADTVIHMLRAKNDLDESVEILESDDVHSHRSRADSEFYGRSLPPPLGQEKIVWDSILALGPATQVSVYKRLRIHLIHMSMLDEPISRSSSTTDIHVRASATSRGASPPLNELSASPAPRPPSRTAQAAPVPPPPLVDPAARLSHQQQQQLREHLPWLQYDSEEAMEAMKLLSLLEASHDDDDVAYGGGYNNAAASRHHKSPRGRSPDGRRRQYYRHGGSLGHNGAGRSGSPPPRRQGGSAGAGVDALHWSPIHQANRRDGADRRPLSPRARQLSPRGRRDLSPRGRRELSPRGRPYRDLSPRRGRRELSPRGNVRQEHSPRGFRPEQSSRREHSPRGRRSDRSDHSPRRASEHSPRGARQEHSPRPSSPRGSPRRRSPVRHPRASSPRGGSSPGLRGSGGARSSASASGGDNQHQTSGNLSARRRPPPPPHN
jgi:hypothetical protein